jgi:hypothetical protein
MISSVLRGAIEAHNSNSASDSSSNSSNNRLQIGMDGVSIEDWMKVARFLYPVPAPAEIQGWQEAELLLRVGAQFDMPLLLQAANRYIVQDASELVRSEACDFNIWKWLKLADNGLQDSLAAIAAHAVKADRPGCIVTSNLEQLSWSAMCELIKALVPVPCQCCCHDHYRHGASCQCTCRPQCPHCPTSPTYSQTGPTYAPGSPNYY